MANVDIDFSGFIALRRQIERLNNVRFKRKCMETCAKQLANVYLGEAIKNTPVGGAKEFGVTEKAYGQIQAMEVGAKKFRIAKSRNYRSTRAVKRIKNSRTKGKQYLVMTASEHMRRSWDADDLQKKGNVYSVKIFNSASYASYVNDGHRQTPGRYVSAIGKRLVRNWVDGLFIAEKAERKVKKMSGKVLSQIIDRYLKGGGGIG